MKRYNHCNYGEIPSIMSYEQKIDHTSTRLRDSPGIQVSINFRETTTSLLTIWDISISNKNSYYYKLIFQKLVLLIDRDVKYYVNMSKYTISKFQNKDIIK